ncbi:hypothetical protein CALVIDRAFT_219353 [Calocera viscosa TUFC12733]|uniref:Uncharacterized protein n=1 Tax=Calocera viscosa (strain TUFC12733) TaxID=1330018 RepID=A0A167RJ50_CALVF|nr:hypothetical protein CALVIDRAFT_219353 [Calocera viscosa TUFC12733]
MPVRAWARFPSSGTRGAQRRISHRSATRTARDVTTVICSFFLLSCLERHLLSTTTLARYILGVHDRPGVLSASSRLLPGRPSPPANRA